MIYNTTSVKTVIAKVLTDLDLQEEVHRISDCVEWAGEALEKIGAFPTLQVNITGKGSTPFLAINNYQVALPSGLHSIIQAAYSTKQEGPYIPMRMATGSFDISRTINIDGVEQSETTYQTDNTVTDVTYGIKPGYLVTNKKDGYIMLAYQSIPIDEDGYPLIPDDISFREALYWYISMKMMYPMWKIGKLRDAVYYDARRSWNYYCKQAYGNAMMPNNDQLESIKNSWLRLVPQINASKEFFSTLGQQEHIYNQNGSTSYAY